MSTQTKALGSGKVWVYRLHTKCWTEENRYLVKCRVGVYHCNTATNGTSKPCRNIDSKLISYICTENVLETCTFHQSKSLNDKSGDILYFLIL